MLDGKKKRIIKSDFYGLTGAGLEMRDAPIKVLIRHPDINALCNRN